MHLCRVGLSGHKHLCQTLEESLLLMLYGICVLACYYMLFHLIAYSGVLRGDHLTYLGVIQFVNRSILQYLKYGKHVLLFFAQQSLYSV